MSNSVLDDFQVDDYGNMEGDFVVVPPGTYHLAVTSVSTTPTKPNGEAIHGLEVSFEVLGGSVDGQEEAEIKDSWKFKEVFYWPSLNNKDGGKFLCKRIGRLTSVLNVGRPGMKLGEIPYGDMVARHCVAKVRHEKFTGNHGNEIVLARIDGLNMWHVASPEVAKIPKDQDAIKMVPMGGDPFTEASDNGNGRAKAPPAPPAQSPAASSAVESL